MYTTQEINKNVDPKYINILGTNNYRFFEGVFH